MADWKVFLARKIGEKTERKEKRESDRMNKLRAMEQKYNISMSNYYVDYCAGRISKSEITSIIEK